MDKFTQPIKWHGGKHYLAPDLVKIATQVEHCHRVEAFAGGLSFSLAMPFDSVSEVANDLNTDLTNFWCVMADATGAFEEFQRLCEATPFSQIEWDDAAKRMALPYVPQFSAGDAGIRIPSPRRAWLFFIFARQSMSGRMQDFAPSSKNRVRRGMNEQVSAWLTAVEGLEPVHRRLIRFFIMNVPATKCIQKNDGAKTLQYLDPPYLPDTRTAPEVYLHEMKLADHVELLDCVTDPERQSKFIISHYRHELYDEKLKGWRRYDFDLPNNAASGELKRRKTECVWTNF